MIRDHFYRQIVERLAGGIDPELFEQCASDLLRDAFPTLVPMRGGSDAGMDGAIADALGEPFPLICTVGLDVIGNLTGNLKSYLKEGGKRRRVILATSQSLTPKRKRNLTRRASDLGFTLSQVYDQSAFADRLYRNSKWCLELLDLTGEPPALSAIPKSNRAILNQELIGRDSDLSWLRDIQGDALLIGQPGSGKTFLMHKLALEDDALFAVSKNRTELAAGIRDQMPATVIVDDAGSSLEVLNDLKQIREEIDAEFSILACCWPGDQDSVAQTLNLTASSIHLLGLLTRDEIVDVIKATGLLGSDDLIREIVNQAEGRPGLAATLANLALRGEVKEVAFGEALGKEILLISEEATGKNTVEVLAAFSVGGNSGMSMQLVADGLGLGLVEVRQIVTDLAAAGVIYDEVNRQFLSVRPAALRFVLIRDVFFKGGASLRVDPFLTYAPDLKESVLTIIGATARGAVVSQPFLTGLLEQINNGDAWAQYASLGRPETSWVLQRYPELVASIAGPALHWAPEIAVPLLLQEAVGDQFALHSTPEHPIRLIIDWAHSGYPGTGDGVTRRKVIVDCVRSWFAAGRDVRVGLMVLKGALSPAFQDSTTDPGFGKTLTIRSAFLTQGELVEIQDLWPKVMEIIQRVEIADWKPIQGAIEDWAYPGRMRTASSELDDALRHAARQMLRDVVRLAKDRPGVLQWARKIAEDIDESDLGIPIDVAFETLHPAWTGDYRAAEASQRAAVSELAKSLVKQDPKHVATRIVRIEWEAQSISVNWPNYTPLLCEEIARLTESPLRWARAFIESDATGETICPFLKHAAKLDEEGWIQLAEACLAKPELTQSIVSLVLTLEFPPDGLLNQTLQKLDRVAHLINILCHGNDVSDEIIGQLLQHQNADIATAAALGVWQAEPYGKIPDSIYDQWREAIKNADSDDHWLSEILKGDSSLSFIWLKERLSDKPIVLFRLDDAVNAAADALNGDDRRKILHNLPLDYPLHELVERIVGVDLDLYRELLNHARSKEIHLLPLAGRPEGLWLDKAILALDAGYNSEDVASAMYPHFMSWWGEESAMWAQWIEEFNQLLAHQDQRIQKVGELGKARAEASRDHAIERERLVAIRGI